MALEMVVLTPVFVGCILTIAGGARYVEARGQVSSSAMSAARAASLEPAPQTAVPAGRAAAMRSLMDRGPACVDLVVDVDVAQFRAGGAVRATVRCTADLSDLVGYGLPGTRTFIETAVVPIESHRVVP